MDRRDLSATTFLTSRFTTLVLALVGLWFFFQPAALGWGWFAEVAGGDLAAVSLGVGLAFFLLAIVTFEVSQLRVRTAEVLEGMHQLLYGKDFRRDREAIEILLTALETGDKANAANAHQHLVRLTGQNFAADARVWRAWWSANERTWSRAAGSGEGGPPRPGGRGGEV